MTIKELLHQMNPPCIRCPYQMGLVRTLVNPCPQCKRNGYEMYKRFQKQQTGK